MGASECSVCTRPSALIGCLQGGEAVVAAGTTEFLRVAIGRVVSTKVNRDILKVEKKLVIFEHEKKKAYQNNGRTTVHEMGDMLRGRGWRR